MEYLRIYLFKGRKAAKECVYHSIMQASMQKSPMDSMVTRFAKWYTPIVVLAALCIVVIPIGLGVANKRVSHVHPCQGFLSSLVTESHVADLASVHCSCRTGCIWDCRFW